MVLGKWKRGADADLGLFVALDLVGEISDGKLEPGAVLEQLLVVGVVRVALLHSGAHLA